MKEFFTRLTSNFNEWKSPSASDGKCNLQEQTIYEGRNGFGWEEWLFKDYHLNNAKPDFECKGFIQAMNQQKIDVQHIDRLFLYTKVCENNRNIAIGTYYVGYINDVLRFNSQQDVHEVINDLHNMNLYNQNTVDNMLPFSINIKFKVKNVHINFDNIFQQPIQLNFNQYRFGLYQLERHLNFRREIQMYQ